MLFLFTATKPKPRSRQPGSIGDYDPAGENKPSPHTSKTQSTTVYTSANGQRQGGLTILMSYLALCVLRL